MNETYYPILVLPRKTCRKKAYFPALPLLPPQILPSRRGAAKPASSPSPPRGLNDAR